MPDVNKGREIVSIVWYPHRPDWHEVVYSDGYYERVPGNQADAAALAESLGMQWVLQEGTSIQWERKG